MSKNKRVIGAEEVVYDDIKFRSKLELYTYKKLISNNFDFEYEGMRVDLIPSFELNSTEVYYPVESGKQKGVMKQRFKVDAKTYKVDFVVKKDNYHVFIECKGYANDDYPTKRKLFLKWLEATYKPNDEITPIFWEPHNQKQVNDCIEFIKNLKKLNNEMA